MPSTYHPKTVARKIIDALSQSDVDTPTGIARKTGYNPKTISKYVEMLEDLGKVECKKIPIGNRQIKACSLKRQRPEG